jgi:hypothetical protein
VLQPDKQLDLAVETSLKAGFVGDIWGKDFDGDDALRRSTSWLTFRPPICSRMV